ncbi:MAG: ribosome small subunit-dependent GTPase A [Myxococcales bacterium]|nr:ribosome small subunit-dependent GTPase A [Myxococcales bacterium]
MDAFANKIETSAYSFQETCPTGWGPFFEAHLHQAEETAKIGRVVAVDRGGAWVILRKDLAALSPHHAPKQQVWQSLQQWGKWLPSPKQRQGDATSPLVGDWVLFDETEPGQGRIQMIFPRRSYLARKTAGTRTEAQGVAANLDHIAIVTSANQDFSLGRTERYLAAIWESGAKPSVLLNKIDQSPDRYEEMIEQLERVALGVPIFPISALYQQGLQAFLDSLQPGSTLALVGSSGVGKSTLLNACVQSATQITHETRLHDEQGKHTTTRRELFLGDRGIWWIDTPGMREFSPWDAQEGIRQVFADIEGYASKCHFRDCTHHQEPGCAVQQAIEDGQLDPARLERHQALQREAAYQQERVDQRAAKEKKERWKSITKSVKERQKLHRKLGLKEW